MAWMEVLKAEGSFRLCDLRLWGVLWVGDFDTWDDAAEEASESDAEESVANDSDRKTNFAFFKVFALGGGEVSASDSSSEVGLNSASGDGDGEE